jgi:hypothetical protein
MNSRQEKGAAPSRYSPDPTPYPLKGGCVSSVPQAEQSRTRRYRGSERLYLVGGEHGQASPDDRITEEDRQLVRQLVAELESALSAEVLMLVSGGVEAAAWRKRGLEAST